MMTAPGPIRRTLRALLLWAAGAFWLAGEALADIVDSRREGHALAVAAAAIALAIMGALL